MAARWLILHPPKAWGVVILLLKGLVLSAPYMFNIIGLAKVRKKVSIEVIFL